MQQVGLAVLWVVASYSQGSGWSGIDLSTAADGQIVDIEQIVQKGVDVNDASVHVPGMAVEFHTQRYTISPQGTYLPVYQ